MKKIVCILTVMIALAATKASAQGVKIAYIRVDDIVSLMPELQKVNMDTVGTQFITDSIKPEFDKLTASYQVKAQELETVRKGRDTATIIRITNEVDSIQGVLQGAQEFVQRVIQAKQNQFLQPFYKKVRDAISAVAKRKGYTHVVSTDILVYALPADDISLLVLTELKIELPKPQGQQTRPNTGATRPPARNN